MWETIELLGLGVLRCLLKLHDSMFVTERRRTNDVQQLKVFEPFGSKEHQDENGGVNGENTQMAFRGKHEFIISTL